MPRRIRRLPEGQRTTLVEVSTRTLQARFLLTPTPELNEVAVGVIGRALQMYPVTVCAFSMLSNHYHALIEAESQLSLSSFMGYLNGNLAKEVARLTNWPEKVWSRRYDGIVVSNEPEAQWSRLKYVLSQGTKEGLVASPYDWQGVHSARPLAYDEALEGVWFNRTEEWAARRRGEEFEKYDYATKYRVELAPLPCFRHLLPEEYRDQVAALVREIEEEAAKKRGDRPVLGMATIRQQNPHDHPDSPKRSPAPRFHAASREQLEELIDEYSDFLQRYRLVSKRLRSGRLEAARDFPTDCFPPALPYVSGGPTPPLPRVPQPPTRRIDVEETGDVFRSEIPLIVVPCVTPPIRGQPASLMTPSH